MVRSRKLRSGLLIGAGFFVVILAHVHAFRTDRVTAAQLLSWGLAWFLGASGVLVLLLPQPRRAVVGLGVSLLLSVVVVSVILRQTFS